MRALLVTVLAAVVILVSMGMSAGRSASGEPADALGAQDEFETESESEEDAPSEDDAARVQVADATVPARRIGARMDARLGLASDDGHSLPLFRPPIA